jgi:hypothetical protein
MVDEMACYPQPGYRLVRALELAGRVIGSELLESNKKFLRNAPDDAIAKFSRTDSFGAWVWGWSDRGSNASLMVSIKAVLGRNPVWFANRTGTHFLNSRRIGSDFI